MKKPTNEPILEYKKGSPERKALDEALEKLAKNPVDVPLVIGSERIMRNLERKQLMVNLLIMYNLRITQPLLYQGDVIAIFFQADSCFWKIIGLTNVFYVLNYC